MSHADGEWFERSYLDARWPSLTALTAYQEDAIVGFYCGRRAGYIEAGLESYAAARRALRDVSKTEWPQ